MVKYRVMQDSDGHAPLALQDNLGRHHLARALSTPPARGSTLVGEGPHLGFSLLICMRSGQAFRFVFESINTRGPAVAARR
jgi:hypothetical protein